MIQAPKGCRFVIGSRLTSHGLIISAADHNENSFCDEMKYPEDTIDAMKEVDCPTDDSEIKLSSYKT